MVVIPAKSGPGGSQAAGSFKSTAVLRRQRGSCRHCVNAVPHPLLLVLLSLYCFSEPANSVPVDTFYAAGIKIFGAHNLRARGSTPYGVAAVLGDVGLLGVREMVMLVLLGTVLGLTP